jgi:hypothetical protein
MTKTPSTTRQTQGFFLLPHTPKVVLSDNGSEFEADFARLLEDQGTFAAPSALHRIPPRPGATGGLSPTGC